MSAACETCAFSAFAETRIFTYGRVAEFVRWQIAVVRAAVPVPAFAVANGTAAAAATSRMSSPFIVLLSWISRSYARGALPDLARADRARSEVGLDT
jgi:hypothetical protein